MSIFDFFVKFSSIAGKIFNEKKFYLLFKESNICWTYKQYILLKSRKFRPNCQWPILNENISGSSKGNVWEHKSLWEILLQNLSWRRRHEIKMKNFGPLNGNNDLKCALDVSTIFHYYVLGGWYRWHNIFHGNKVATHECTLLVLSKKQTTIFPLEISCSKTANLCTHGVTFFSGRMHSRVRGAYFDERIQMKLLFAVFDWSVGMWTNTWHVANNAWHAPRDFSWIKWKIKFSFKKTFFSKNKKSKKKSNYKLLSRKKNPTSTCLYIL